MPDLYRVISELLTTVVPLLDDGSGPTETYRIAELVVAGSRSQAKWLAWKTDRDSYTGRIRDMPKFQIKRVAVGVSLPVGIVTDFESWQSVWEGAEASA